ncbi:MAG: pilin [Minisyncoccia bacterium]
MDILIAFSRSLIGLIDVVLVPLIFAAAFVAFIWGVYLYFFLGAGNEEKRKEGRTFVVYGLIGFVLMLSLWGIVRMLTTSFGLGGQNRPALPFESTPRQTPPRTQSTSPAPPGAPINPVVEERGTSAYQECLKNCVGQCEPDGTCSLLY